MPMCGFNQKMLEELDSFHNGLVESVLDKVFVDERSEEEERGGR
ncbi:MAG: hypothetical protein ABIH92_04235 [Nanoarchaeota archaeon]